MTRVSKATVGCLVLFLASCASEKPAQQPPPVPVERPIEKSNAPPPAGPSASVPSVASSSPAPTTPGALADDPTAKPIGKEEARILVKALPLRLDAVRFEAMTRFLLLYAPFTPNKALLRVVWTSLDGANGRLKIPVSTFSLSMGVDEYVGLLKENRDYLRVLDGLSSAVARTKDVIIDFRERADAQLDDGQRAAIEAQVGARPTDNSVAFRNLTEIRRLAQAGNFQFKSGVK